MGNCEVTPLNPEINLLPEIINMSALEQLKALTKVVADTGDFAAMEKFKPEVCSFQNLSKQLYDEKFIGKIPSITDPL